MAISRGFSAEDLNGVRLPGSVDALADIGVEIRSGIVCDLEFKNLELSVLFMSLVMSLSNCRRVLCTINCVLFTSL